MSVIKSDKLKKNSIQIFNLLKVLNKNKPLENLNDVNDVYDNPVDMIEEIIYFNKFKGNKNLIKDETELNSSELDFAENDQIEDEDFDATKYVKKIKSLIM